jgi:hypothetical protein
MTTFLSIFPPKKISGEIRPKIYSVQDPDPDNFEQSDPDPVKNRPNPQHCF